MSATKNYRKRRNSEGDENDLNAPSDGEEQSRQLSLFLFLLLWFLTFWGFFYFDFGSGFVRLALEEVKFLQKQRERKLGIPAIPTVQVAVGGLALKSGEKGEGGDGEKDDLVLQDTFAQETAVTIEDPNM